MFLPISRADMDARGWDACDFIFVTGDAYVDHPTFGTAILSRLLEDEGFRIGIIAQPDWHSLSDFQKLGRPKYGFLVNAGNVDSMVAHYTVAKRRRSADAYSPGHKTGLRPDRALTVYCKKLREAYGSIPIIVGGLEASLRRFAHYDYWADKVFPSVLEDCGADLLSFGMGEHQTVEIAHRLAAGEPVEALHDIRGVCYFTERMEGLQGVTLPSYDTVKRDKTQYAIANRIEYDEQDNVRGRALIQPHGHRYLVQTRPSPALTTPELDRVHELPYERWYHPCYEAQGGVPAIEEVEFSITHNRGCFGACNFCSIAFHQGRQVTVRSEASVLREAKSFLSNPHFKGYISDVGGPTANFRHPSCKRQGKYGLCKGKKCLAPTPCPHLDADESEYLHLLRSLRAIPGIKKVFIRSGIRYDYMLKDPEDAFFKELITHHVSGQLRVAPEHCSAMVLDKMGKPHIEAYREFSKKFYEYTGQIGKKQYIVPYLMSSHPGCTMQDAVKLALFLRELKMRPEQVQDFYPTPGSLSTCMYYTGLDPRDLTPVYVPDPQEKAMQRALLQYFKPKNRGLVADALLAAGRQDLIGYGKHCLIPPPPGYHPPTPKPAEKKGKKKGKAPAQKSRSMGGRWDPKKKR